MDTFFRLYRDLLLNMDLSVAQPHACQILHFIDPVPKSMETGLVLYAYGSLQAYWCIFMEMMKKNQDRV